MKIFADKNILDAETAFAGYGELHLFDGRSVEHSDLVDADVLLVRSITQVNRSLLEGTNIGFVGTATSGVDHVDIDYLQAAGIHFVDAKGSNANAVVDYCFTALAYVALRHGFVLSESSVGIVGAGAVGSLFAAKLEKLGVTVRCCDPFLAEDAADAREYCSLEAALECSVVSLHVPLTENGAHPTQHLLGSAELNTLCEGALLINACRGGVVDEAALQQLLSRRRDIITVFDVWKDEPDIDASLVHAMDVATPHIAGYSMEAKSNATELLSGAIEERFGLGSESGNAKIAKMPESIALPCEAGETAELNTLLEVFPLIELSDKFKGAAREGGAAKAFDALRQELLTRREFESLLLDSSIYSSLQMKQLSILGFSFE